MKDTHDWSIDKPYKADFEKDMNCMISCVKAKKCAEIVIPTIEFSFRSIILSCLSFKLVFFKPL